MPGTLPRLVYCQNVQLLQPAGIGGRSAPNAATHSWPAPNAAPSSVQVFHQSAVV
jgi:hypothetical protein